jgi:hypothetical protein
VVSHTEFLFLLRSSTQKTRQQVRKSQSECPCTKLATWCPMQTSSKSWALSLVRSKIHHCSRHLRRPESPRRLKAASRLSPIKPLTDSGVEMTLPEYPSLESQGRDANNSCVVSTHLKRMLKAPQFTGLGRSLPCHQTRISTILSH